MSLSICSLNVHGLRDSVKCKKVLSFLNIFAFDIVLLQETYLGSSDIKAFKSIWKGPVFYSVAFSNHSCGVIIAFSSTLPCTYSQVRFDNEGRYVSVLCSFNNNVSFRICNIYAPCDPAKRVEFFNSLFYHIRGSESIILGGDFNCVLNQKDKSGDSLNSTCFVGKKELCTILRSFSLIDSWLKVNSDKGHTWFHLGKQQSSRIDKIYVGDNFNVIKSVTIPFHFSDHVILNTFVSLPNVQNNFKSYWKFNVSLCKNDSFVQDFVYYYHLWQTLKPGFNSVVEWWENIKQRIKDLCIKYGVKLAKEKRDHLHNLQNICVSANKDVVSSLLQEEGRGAYIRSREKFLEGKEKPGFFHMNEKLNANFKFIKEVRNKEGVVVSGEEMVSVFHQFFTDLYKCDNNIDLRLQEMFLNSVQSCISLEKSDFLDRPITLEEIKRAIFVMSKNKSPGIDGLPIEFYQRFFDVICDDLLMLYNEIYSIELLSNSQRTAIITLLPKGGDMLDPTNRRPISLLTVDYKIISKVLQLRFSEVLPDIINEFQTCSVSGRSIHLNLCLLRDVIDCAELNDIACAIISMDQCKAFDKVDWNFLFRVLEKFNFGNYIIKWVRILYSDIKSRILINGQLSDDVCIQRGVRQGCPLSPILYVLFIEPLAQFMLSHKGIRGFHIPGGGGKFIKLLQYADDTTCFASSQNDIIRFFESFKSFEKATGASLNMKKTHGLKLGGFVGRKLRADIDWSEEGVKINGIFFGSKFYIQSFWKSLYNKASKKLKTWENRGLSLIGKIGIINSCIFSLFYYAAKVYIPSDDFVSKILKLVFEFIWKKKTELVSRNVIMLEEKNGGLNLDNLQFKMKALFIGNILSFLSGKDTMSCNFLFFRYFLASKLRRMFPFLWSNLVPHSENLSFSYRQAWTILVDLYTRNTNFVNVCKHTSDIVSLLVPGGCVPRVVAAAPARDWHTTWRMIQHPLLCNTLKSFSWKLIHGALFTREKLFRWGIGNGKCSFCSGKESIFHIFWDCNVNYKILCWVNKVTTSMLGSNLSFDKNLFLFGSSVSQLDASVWARVWFLYLVVQKSIWHRRCVMVFEKVFISDDDFILRVKDEIRVRILVDLKRWPRFKFDKTWIQGKAFCSVVDNDINVHLP